MPSPQVVANNVLRLLKQNLDSRAQRALYGRPVLYELGDKYPLPTGMGYEMYIPRHFSQNHWGALTEYTRFTPSATSAGRYSGSVAGYGDARIYSDFLRLVMSVPSQVPNDMDDMMRYGAKKIDDLCRAQISGGGTLVAPDGATTSNIRSATNLKMRALFEASTVLASNNALEYENGLYRGVFHPRQTFDLFLNGSGGQAISYNWLTSTEIGAKKLERMTISVLGRVQVIESTWSPKFSAGVEGASAGACCYTAYVMGPGAFAAIDLATAQLKTYIKGPGTAGALDPIDQISTVGAKFYFGAAQMDVTNRQVRITSGKTL